MDKGFVYILRSIKNNKFYIGSTIDIHKRMNRHRQGDVASTRNLRPLKLELFQEYKGIYLARKIERQLKKLKRRDFIEKIIKEGVIKMGQ